MPKTTQANCDGSKRCQVDVWVEACPYATLNQCLGAGFNFVVARRGVKTDIEWQLTDPKDPGHPTAESYAFDAETGIVFVDPIPEPGEFRCGPQDRGRRYVCVNRHSNKEPVVFKYTIKVVNRAAPPSVDPLDPWLINE